MTYRTNSSSAGRIAVLVVLLLGLGLPPVSARQSDNVKSILPQFESSVLQILKTTGVPGLAIGIVHRDQIIYLKGFGVREAGKPAAVDPDTVFQLASVSKTIASTVVAALVGDGVLSWDDPIIKHDPSFRLSDPWVTEHVTIRDMFSHRSGLPDHAGDALEDIGFDRAAVLHRLRYQKLESSLRSRYKYTNFGLTAAAVAAAKASGKSWEDASADRLYRPLGMNNTSSRYSDFLKAPNRALGHVSIDGKWTARYQRNPDAQSPAGGVSSTVRDLTQLLRLHLAGGRFNGREIIAAPALAETHRPQMVSRAAADPAKDRPEFYGLGVGVSYDEHGRVRYSHSGGFNLGAATHVALLPSEQIGIVVLSNVQPVGVPEAVAKIFFDLALSGRIERDWMALFGEAFREMFKPDYGTLVDYNKPAVRPTAAMPLERYAGVYRNDFAGDVEVVGGNGRLSLRLGPARTEFPMKHYDRDVFTYQPVGENAYGPSAITFTVAADGKATSVLIEILNITGEGTFTRSAAK